MTEIPGTLRRSFHWLDRHRAPAPAAPPHRDGPGSAAATPALDPEVVALWARHTELTAQTALSLAARAEVRLALGLCLATRRAALVRTAGTGDFHAWLRYHQIPSTTAYRLIASATAPAGTDRGATSPSGTPPARAIPAVSAPHPPSGWALAGPSLTLHFTPSEAEQVRTALAILGANGFTAHIAPMLASVLGLAASCCPPHTPHPGLADSHAFLFATNLQPRARAAASGAARSA